MIPLEWTNGIAYDLCFIGNTLRSYPFLKLFTYNWNRKSCKVGILRYQYFCEKSGSRRNILQTVFCCMGNYHFIVQDIYSQTLQYQLSWGNNVSSACIFILWKVIQDSFSKHLQVKYTKYHKKTLSTHLQFKKKNIKWKSQKLKLSLIEMGLAVRFLRSKHSFY